MPDPNLVSRINGVPYSWTSCAHMFNGAPYKGITKVNWKESRKRIYVPSAAQDGTPLGITSGVYRVESLSFTLHRSTWEQGLATDLTAIGLGSYGDASFDYLLQLFEPGNIGALPSQTVIGGCVVEEVEEDQEFSEDGGPYLVSVITCKAIAVFKTVNGLPLQLWSQIRALL
jgi:hypothetical protein